MIAEVLRYLLKPLSWALRWQPLVWLFGYEIGPNAKIGFSLILVERPLLAAVARVGHLEGLRRQKIRERARLGHINWVTGFPAGVTLHFTADVSRGPSLVIQRHLIDFTDRVTIGEFSTFAGWRSQIVTHAIDLRQSRQASAPVSIGRYCFLGTGSLPLKGVKLSDSVLAAGSVLSAPMFEEGALYSGVLDANQEAGRKQRLLRSRSRVCALKAKTVVRSSFCLRAAA